MSEEKSLFSESRAAASPWRRFKILAEEDFGRPRFRVRKEEASDPSVTPKVFHLGDA